MVDKAISEKTFPKTTMTAKMALLSLRKRFIPLTKLRVTIPAVLTILGIYFLCTNQYLAPLPVKEDCHHMLNDTSCYRTPDVFLKSVDFYDLKKKTIFFIECSCKGSLNSKQACSVESAAESNSDWMVMVLFAGPLNDAFINSDTATMLLKIPNVQFARLNAEELAVGTPFEELFVKNVLKQSIYPVTHSSDILRMLILYKYSGLYLDLDVMVIRSFRSLPQNFVAKEASEYIGSAILAFAKDEIGRKFLEIAARELASSYQPKLWDWNGPALISRTLKKICNTTTVSEMNANTCNGIEVFESKYFFPIPYPSWKKYYEDSWPSIGEEFTHHMWNAMAYKNEVPQNSVYAKLAERYCPSVFKIYGTNFGV